MEVNTLCYLTLTYMSEETTHKDDNNVTVKNSIGATITVAILMALAIIWAHGQLPEFLIGLL